MNKWWGPPGEGDDATDDAYDAWFDVWIEEDGSLGSYFGQRAGEAAVADLKESMHIALRDLLSGKTKRMPHRKDPSPVVDLDQAVLLIRVVHQRNGAVSCGWGRFAEDVSLLRPLGELATIAAEKLPSHPVSIV
jgi:hypothetical protein